MRSRSSLLSHIILSNDKFVGMGESNATYTGYWRVYYMKLKSLGFWKLIPFFRKDFVDQINHNIKTPNQELLLNPDIKLIILIRNPIDSIKSIMRLTNEYFEPWSYERARDYYCERLEYLEQICIKKDKADILIVNSDSLILDTDNTLIKLSRFLGLSSNLNSNYSKFNFTGIKGDPSNKIQTGEVLKSEKISHNLMDVNNRASSVYLNFVEKYIDVI